MNYYFEENKLSYPSHMSCKKDLRTKAQDREVYQKSRTKAVVLAKVN